METASSGSQVHRFAFLVWHLNVCMEQNLSLKGAASGVGLGDGPAWPHSLSMAFGLLHRILGAPCLQGDSRGCCFFTFLMDIIQMFKDVLIGHVFVWPNLEEQLKDMVCVPPFIHLADKEEVGFAPSHMG